MVSDSATETRRYDRVFVVAGFLLVGIASFVGLFLPRHIVFNATPSLPEGFYRVHHNRADLGDLVWFQAPPRIHALSTRRGYLPADAHFAKRVIGEEGAVWCVRDGRFIVDGTTYGPVFDEDSAGRPLPQRPGCHVVPEGRVLVGTPHAHSVDSRYFGSVPRTSVRGTLTRLWTWRCSAVSRIE